VNDELKQLRSEIIELKKKQALAKVHREILKMRLEIQPVIATQLKFSAMAIENSIAPATLPSLPSFVLPKLGMMAYF
jgi:hypothetical protein